MDQKGIVGPSCVSAGEDAGVLTTGSPELTVLPARAAGARIARRGLLVSAASAVMAAAVAPARGLADDCKIYADTDTPGTEELDFWWLDPPCVGADHCWWDWGDGNQDRTPRLVSLAGHQYDGSVQKPVIVVTCYSSSDESNPICSCIKDGITVSRVEGAKAKERPKGPKIAGSRIVWQGKSHRFTVVNPRDPDDQYAWSADYHGNLSDFPTVFSKGADFVRTYHRTGPRLIAVLVKSKLKNGKPANYILGPEVVHVFSTAPGRDSD